jgi:transcriptional regulator with XRE-family HTH domain
VNGAILGAAVRSFRLRRRQMHNGKPWALDDLAVAIDGDKAHLSRIERGMVLPSRATLLRIAQALGLTRPETEFLLRLAGFTPLLGPPGPDAVAAATRWLASQSRAYPNPFSLYTLDTRVWYANALWLRVMGLTTTQFRACMQGRDLLLSQYLESAHGRCSTLDHIYRRYRNAEEQLTRAIARFRAAVMEGHVAEETATKLLANAEFRALWDAAEVELPQASLAGEQNFSAVAYPGRGVLRFDTWWCPLQIDRRFIVILHVPHDAHTREATREIRHDPRPAPTAPCPVHGPHCGSDAPVPRLRKGERSPGVPLQAATPA